MESAKKILPYILIAIVFAVGGYFIGKGSMSNQQAALYQAAMTRTQIGGVQDLSTSEPTGGVGPLFKTATGTSRPASFRAWLGANGCWEVSGSKWTPVGGEEANASAEGCLAIKMAPKVNTSK